MTSDAVSAERRTSTPPFQPAADVLSGETADVYFERARRILAAEGLDPVVTMEVFARREAILCGIDEVKNLLAHVLATSEPPSEMDGGVTRGDPPADSASPSTG